MVRDIKRELQALKRRAGNVKSREIIAIAEASGWIYRNTRGGHTIHTKQGARRPLSVPQHAKDLKKGTALKLLRIIEEAL